VSGQQSAHGWEPLAGLTVLELGDGVAGASATDVLAALGAAVTTVAASDSVLRALRPQLDGSSVLSAVLDSRKQVATGMASDRLLREIALADVVVCDRVHRAAAGLPAMASDYLPFVAKRNRGAWVTVSAFGMDGPKGDVYGSELTVAAASSVLGIVRDPESGRLVKLPGAQALLSAGAAAALAALHALSELAATGEPQHASVSAQAAALMTGPVIQCAAPMLNTEEAGGAARFGAPSGLYECRDGAVWIMAMEQHQWAGIIRVLGDPEWARSFASVDDRIDRADECNALLAEAVRPWGRFELEVAMQREGVPACVLRDPQDLLASPQFAFRGAFRDIEMAGRPGRVVTAPFRLVASDGHPAAAGERVTRTIRGLRILEASHILAVPLAGSLLGACGADVVKVEDPHRPDSYRTRGPYIDGHVDKDWSAYFALMNHSKHSLDVDLSNPANVASLLDAVDVVIENYGLNRATRFGIASGVLSRDRPGLLAISSSGFGHTGPAASYRAYAYGLQAGAGLQQLTRGRTGALVPVNMAAADLLTGYAIATIVAAWAVGPGPRSGASADVAMSDLIASRLSEFVAAAALGLDEAPEPGDTRQSPYAPNGVYPTADDRAVAVSVLTDPEWAALKSGLGHPEALDQAAWRTAAGRAADQDALDLALEAAIGGFTADELVANLSRAGVMISPVYSVAEVVAAGGGCLDPVYRPAVDHPLWGRRRLLGLAWTFAGRGPATIGPPPPLGSARTAATSWAYAVAPAHDDREPRVSA
jgi:crotonobetainyl-CoA:carnitine CoA-transferase CaiB-like acyl-CoA transferase